MSKHTPGSWEVNTSTIGIWSSEGPQVASLDSEGSPNVSLEESLANAYLMAAAPEMLAVLKKVLPEIDDNQLMWEVSDAIDKAEGRVE